MSAKSAARGAPPSVSNDMDTWKLMLPGVWTVGPWFFRPNLLFYHFLRGHEIFWTRGAWYRACGVLLSGGVHMLDLNIQSFYLQGCPGAHLQMKGSVDSLDALKLERELSGVVQQGARIVVVDMSEIGFVSSAGWGVFISKVGSLRDSGGCMRFAAMKSDVEYSFDLIGLGSIQSVEVYLSVDEALRAVPKHISSSPEN